MIDTKRLQLDLRNLPEGVAPAFKVLAFEAAITPTDLARRVIIEYVAEHTKDDTPPKPEKAPWS